MNGPLTKPRLVTANLGEVKILPVSFSRFLASLFASGGEKYLTVGEPVSQYLTAPFICIYIYIKVYIYKYLD